MLHLFLISFNSHFILSFPPIMQCCKYPVPPYSKEGARGPTVMTSRRQSHLSAFPFPSFLRLQILLFYIKQVSFPQIRPLHFSISRIISFNIPFSGHREMGARASALPGDPAGSGPLTRPKLEDLPESCIALVLSYLDPPEIAKLARLNRAFLAASSADFIWLPKLPSNYPYILAKLSDQGHGDEGEKDIYARLCRPSPFDGGTKVSSAFLCWRNSFAFFFFL